MVPPRLPKTDASSPDSLAVPGGGGVAVDRLYDLIQRVSSVEKSMTYLEGHADDARKKLDSISTEITAAKATYGTLKWVLGIAGAIFLALWGFMATILTMVAKHYLGW